VKPLLVACAAIFALSIQSAQACRLLNLEAAREQADIIFVGTPIKILPLLPSEDAPPAADGLQKVYEFYFEVVQVIKGPVIAKVLIRFAIHHCSWPSYKARMRPFPLGYYLVYARKNKSGRYYEDTYFPTLRLPRIDPRFPSVIWTLNPNRLAVRLYWLRMKNNRFRWGFESHVTQQIGMILPHKDGVIHAAQ
jgi:hypothetical protein